MSLTFNHGSGAYVVRALPGSDEALLATSAGLTFSTTGNVWFTRDEYAALPFWQGADALARAKLGALRNEYELSWAKEYNGPAFPAPEGMRYHPFQSAGIAYALARKSCLIGDQPGLGKTIQAIGLANAINAKRVLVICPASVRLQWRKELRLWSMIPRVAIYPILKSSDGVNPRANYTVVSYEIVRNPVIHRVLCSMDWDLVVIDEGHYLKTISARRTRAIFGGGDAKPFDTTWIAQHTDRILALTGTPLPNRPRECYTLVRALCWDAIDWQSEDDFRWRYNPSARLFTDSGKPFVVEEVGRLPELRCRMRCNVMVRRHKRDVLTQLPAATCELTYVEETGAIAKALRAESLLHIDPTKLQGCDIDGAVSTVRRQMGEAMVPRVIEHVSTLMDGGTEKLVVFAWHKSVIEALARELARFGVVVVDGSASSVAKYRAVQEFRTNPGVGIFLANLMSGGTGVDGLQEVCSHAVFAEASWVPGDNQQCIDRLHRIGQPSSVLAQFLVATGSFAERVLGTAISKMQDIHSALDGGR